MVTKHLPGLPSQLLAVEDGEMSQTGISITQLREIYFKRFFNNNKTLKVLQHAMIPDFINTRNQENESFTLNKAFMSPCLLFHLIQESFILNLSWCTIRKQTFCKNKNVGKSIKIYPDYKVVPLKYQAVLEILRWCWRFKNVILHHS